MNNRYVHRRYYILLISFCFIIISWGCLRRNNSLTFAAVAAAFATTSESDYNTNNYGSKKRPFRIFYDSSNYLHRDIQFHSEQPERISYTIKALDKHKNDNVHHRNSNFELIDVAPEIIPSEVNKIHEPFSDKELRYAREILLRTHRTELVTQLEERCNKSKQQRINDGKDPLGHIGRIDFDTYVTTESFNVCLRATAAWIRAVEDGFAMALTRPPGHHATYSLQNGFCLYNFAAATALHTLIRYKNYNKNIKISILDWDVHYGQGVADIISNYKDNIRYVSIHQVPAFPYEGETTQINGNVMTLPMQADTTWTCGYKDLFTRALDFVCNSNDDDNEWKPDVIIICAGYDALTNDPLASVNLNAVDYGRMSTLLCEHLSKHNCKPRSIMLGLEGGYDIANGGQSGNLPDAVVETIKAFLEQDYI